MNEKRKNVVPFSREVNLGTIARSRLGIKLICHSALVKTDLLWLSRLLVLLGIMQNSKKDDSSSAADAAPPKQQQLPATREWALSLVGRDWEIFWSEEVDNAESSSPNKSEVILSEETKSASMEVEALSSTTSTATPLVSHSAAHPSEQHMAVPWMAHASFTISPSTGHQHISQSNVHQHISENNVLPPTSQLENEYRPPLTPSKTEETRVVKMDSSDGLHPLNKEGDQNEAGVGDENQSSSADEDDSSAEGSIIDDWYAGHVIGVGPQEHEPFMFQISFVGDEQVYEMALVPSKVRPSASGWIKRTKALLDCNSVFIANSSGAGDTWETQLPPDTSTLADQPELNRMKKILEAPLYPSLENLLERSSPHQSVDVQGLPDLPTIYRVIRLRYYLQAQIHLRTCLAPIVNLHGSAVEVDGQPNPTEGYVNHLVQCAEDVERACDWYCRCWKLFEQVFADPSDPASVAAGSQKITIPHLLKIYLNKGREVIKTCVSIDTSPAAGQKRKRAGVPSVESGRAKKRRKKVKRFGEQEEDHIRTFLDEFEKDNLLSISSVEAFVASVKANDERWSSQALGSMLFALSKFVVYPVVSWSHRADMILNIDSELVNSLDDSNSVTKTPPQHSVVGSTSTTPVTTEPVTKQGSSAKPIDEDDSSSGDEITFYSFTDIYGLLTRAKHVRLLTSFDLSDQIAKLDRKVAAVKDFEATAVALLSELFVEPSDCTKEKDTVLQGLISLEEESRNSENPVVNVNPIGQNVESVITRKALEDACQVRDFLLDLLHAERIRERLSFVMDLARRGPELPSTLALPNVPDSARWPEKKQSLILRSYKITVSCQDRLSLAKRYEKEMLDHTSHRLRTKQALASAMEDLKHLPVITPAEEMIKIRQEEIEWLFFARSKLPDPEASIFFSELKQLHEYLQQIIDGKSPTLARGRLLKVLRPNNSEETALRAFADKDIAYISEKLSVRVTARFKKAPKWKERADLIISSLRIHGNTLAGERIQSQKQPAMIDIKRIADLLGEYDGLNVAIHGYTGRLQDLYRSSQQWSSNVTSTIENQSLSFQNLLAFLHEQRATRPKGIIIDPTRAVYDVLLDSLAWYCHSKECVQKLLVNAENMASGHFTFVEDYQRTVRLELYPNIAEGAEALQEYSRVNPALQKFDTSSQRTSEILDQLYNIQKTGKAVSTQKLHLSSLGLGISKRITSSEVDNAEGSPMFVMLWYLWQAHVELFVKNIMSSIGPPEAGTNSESASSIPTQALSLSNALRLRKSEPIIKSLPSQVAFLTSVKNEHLKSLDKFIKEATMIEDRVASTLTNTKTLLRGSIRKENEVRDHLASLKELQTVYKSRAAGKVGLSLNPAIGPQLEHQIKIFGWLVKTFSYPLLHLDEVQYSAPMDEKDEGSRIPWEVLVSLHERLPSSEERVGDFALLALRVKELFEAAKSWQDEISVYTMLSNRGGKRRAADQEDSEQSQKVEMDRMKQLAKSPILSKVAMPREGAVNGILESSKKFEMLLHNFLGNDFAESDRAAYPDVESFVGEHGEFVLFRLTGSKMYRCLQSSIRDISEVADKVLAETPGKAAFEWIKEAALWIEELEHAVTIDTPFRKTTKDVLLIPHSKAETLIKKGNEIFLDIPADLKSTLQRYGVAVSPNKQDGTFRVFSKKGIAHHSIGGSTIRWCAILFECLKSDMRSFVGWDMEVSAVLKDCQSYWDRAKVAGSEKLTERVGYKVYCFAENIVDLIEKGKDSLVVSPSKSLLDTLYKVIGDLTAHVAKISPGIILEFSKRRHNESMNLLTERVSMLDALLYRRSLQPTEVSVSQSNDIDEILQDPKSFRDKCRSALDKALRKGTGILKLSELEDAPPPEHLEALCSLKAWEIENLMFDRYQGQVGSYMCTNEYRDKARSLRYNLEDKTNPTLAPKVALGEIDTLTFITMTAEDMASQKVQLERQRLAEEARKGVILTEPTQQTAESNDSRPEKEATDAKDDKPNVSVEGTGAVKENSTNDAVSSQIPDDTGDESDEDGPTLDKEPKQASNTVLRSALAGQTYSSPSLLKATLDASRAASSTARPPPPPSLAASSQVTLSTGRHGHGDRGTRISGKSESNRFKIEVRSLKLVFHAGLYYEGESFPDSINGYLPNFFEVIGRTQEEELKKFLRDKMSGGKWNLIPFRVTMISDSDTTNYKKFYKDYEARGRIAVIKPDDSSSSKVYLLTPKFHRIAKDYTEFYSKTSTYAVLLTKEYFGD